MKKPSHIPQKEWDYALERAERAKRYAETMLYHAPEDDANIYDKYQDPVWQWENEVKGRFSGVVGGNLKP